MRAAVLLFHGPMQSWGGDNAVRAFADSPRTTRRHPTKAAVLGLIRSAMGLRRGEDDGIGLSDIVLASRADKAGRLTTDYQTAQRAHHGFNPSGVSVETPKMHLEDTTFVVLVGHENPEVVDAMVAALRAPAFAPSLGRRACPPAGPLVLGVVEATNLAERLATIPALFKFDSGAGLPVVSDTQKGLAKTAEVRDVMVGTDPAQRLYISRGVHRTQVRPPVIEGQDFIERVVNIRKELAA